MKNIYAFGDIHGEYWKLKKLIDKLNIDKSDTLIFLGDYIDRGAMSFNVIEYLIELDKEYNCVFVLGNHEDMLLDYMYGIYEKVFIVNGGLKTIESYRQNGYNISSHIKSNDRRLPDNHLKFFNRLIPYYEIDDYIFVHAGVIPGVQVCETNREDLVWNRDFYKCNNYKGKVVVFGHTPSRTVMNEKYKICIDTGSCFEGMGNLTCVKLPERVFTSQGATMEEL